MNCSAQTRAKSAINRRARIWFSIRESSLTGRRRPNLIDEINNFRRRNARRRAGTVAGGRGGYVTQTDTKAIAAVTMLIPFRRKRRRVVICSRIVLALAGSIRLARLLHHLQPSACTTYDGLIKGIVQASHRRSQPLHSPMAAHAAASRGGFAAGPTG